MKNSAYSKFAWSVLYYNILVIIWGAFVRASGSGAGCGSHWPDCNGSFIPSFQNFETIIEFTHRLTSGLILPLVLALAYWTYKSFLPKDPIRLVALLSVIFTISEALVGAGLVRFGLVVDNDSLARAIVMSFHLINTFLLLTSLTLTAWWGAGYPKIKIRSQKALAFGLFLALVSLLFLGMSGAVTALGDTLFPTESLIEGIKQDFSPTAHFLVRLRLWHPFIATAVGLYLVIIFGLAMYLRPTDLIRKWGRLSLVLFGVQLFLGLLNFATRAPIELQLIHLFLADMLWIASLITVSTALAEGTNRSEIYSTEAQIINVSRQKLSKKELVKQYIVLTKPRVISLLLFTTQLSMIIAARGWPGTWLFLAVSIGGYMAAGSANAINMVIDRDIDGRMDRTSNRPTVTQEISSQNTLLFALALAIGSFSILTYSANLLCALLAFSGLAFYVIIYSMLLKRRTWHNIVIGGAAGAFPPLVGYAAVSNELTLLAWYLFAIIFVWTPVHFWALALILKEDYKNAGIPMLPVVHGERITVIQIVLYAVLTALISILPFIQHQLGWIYLVPAVILNAVLLLMSIKLYLKPDHPKARGLFKYSMIYLALLFIMIAVDRSQGT